jgi:signal transduction histidine kinase
MAQQVEAMLTEQREFVANASHELRSPLAAVKLRAEALACGTVDVARAHLYAEEINQEMTRLGQLVSDLLQLSKIDNHAFQPPTEATDIHEELSASVRAIRPRLADKHQQFDMSIQDELPAFYIESRDMQLMVGNLLDNAVKYTPENGRINLAATWKEDILTIEVRDNGEGIPPGDLPRVTERFFRVDRAHKRSASGTGLGLALVLATAEQYHGTLIMNSSGVPGEGTRAQLILKPQPAALLAPSAV